MKVTERPLAKIKPYEGNPRLNDEAVEAVAESIRRFGFRQPIVVDSDGVIVCGHTRFRAAEHLGLERVPVHVAADLTPEQVRAYRLADNRTAELAEWNFDLLPIELGDLREAGCDVDGLGWNQGELARLLAGDGDLPASAAGKEYDESVADQVEMTECPECGHEFPK